MKLPLKKLDAVYYLIFVLLATGIWYLHTMSQVQTATLKVQIQWVGIPERALLTQTLPNELEIVVRDQGQQLRNYRQKELSITIDAGIGMQDGLLHINEGILREKLSLILNSSTTIRQIHPVFIQCHYYNQAQKVVPVKVLAHIEADNEYQWIRTEEQGENRVTIYGSEELLSRIDTIYTQRMTYDHLQDTVEIQIPVEIPDGLRVSPKAITMRVYTERFIEKQIALPVLLTHIPDGCQMRVNSETVSVVARVSASHYAEITADDLIAECNYLHRDNTRVPVECQILSPYIYQISKIKPDALDYQVIQQIEDENIQEEDE